MNNIYIWKNFYYIIHSRFKGKKMYELKYYIYERIFTVSYIINLKVKKKYKLYIFN